MNEHQMYDILRKMLTKSNIELISENIIIETEDGGHEIFGEYLITSVNGKYKVSSHRTHLVEYFYTMKNAVIWTTLYKLNKIYAAKRVSDLDSALEGANFNIEVNDKLNKKATDLTLKSIYVAKIVESKAKRVAIKRELDSFEQQVKSWQYQKFNQLVS